MGTRTPYEASWQSCPSTSRPLAKLFPSSSEPFTGRIPLHGTTRERPWFGVWPFTFWTSSQDSDSFDALIAKAAAPDPSFQQVISTSATNELGGLGSRTGKAVPVLISSWSPTSHPGPLDFPRHSATTSLDRIGAEAEKAIPRLARAAAGHQDPWRRDAVCSLSEIGLSLRSNKRHLAPQRDR